MSGKTHPCVLTVPHRRHLLFLAFAALAAATAQGPAGAGAPSSATAPLQPADLLVLPLGDETRRGFGYTYEIRHYPRVAITALLSGATSFTERDAFTVNAMVLQMDAFPKKRLAPEAVRVLGQMLAVRYIVQPVICSGKKGSLAVAIAIIDARTNTEITSVTVERKARYLGPRAAQRALLAASFVAADRMLKQLGRSGETPKQARATPPASQADIAKAESLLSAWDIRATREALASASKAIARQPADARAWAVAARCYGRLADDTNRHPARFHRECRLRATVAADIARHLDPDQPDVRFAAATAEHAARRLVQAEKQFTSATENPKYKDEALAALAILRRAPGTIPRSTVHKPITTATTTIRYMLGQALFAAGQYSESLGAFQSLLQLDSQNVVFAARHAQLWGRAAHPSNYASASVYSSLLAMSASFAELLPAVWDLDDAGKRIAGQALAELQQIFGHRVPDRLDRPQDAAKLRDAMAFLADRERGPILLNRSRSMVPNNPLFRMVKIHSTFHAALADGLVKASPTSERPLALSLLDRLRLHRRLIVEALATTLDALDTLGVYDAADRVAQELDAAFPDDEVAQIAVGMHHYVGGLRFDPTIVTHHFNKARTAWIYYIPQRIRRAHWAVPHEPLDKVAGRFREILNYDLIDPDVVADLAYQLQVLRRWDDATTLIERAIKRDPWRLDLQERRLHIARGKTRRQIPKEAIEKLARDFQDRPGIDEAVAELYYAAGHIPEAEKACREVLKKDLGNQSAFFKLVHLLRLQGNIEESEEVIAAFVDEHPDLIGNAAVRDAVEYYIERREYDRATSFSSENVAKFAPSQGGTICTMGRLSWLTGHRKRAGAEFGRYLRRYGGTPGARYLAELEAVGGNWSEMLNRGKQLRASLPRKLTGYWLEGLYHLHAGSIAQGERSVGTGLAVMCHSPNAYSMFAQWQFYRGNFAQAIQSCQDGQKFVDGAHHKWLDVTELRARLVLGETAGVPSIVQRLRLFDPLDIWTPICEALWLIHERNFVEARKAIEMARRFNPRHTHVQVAYGRILTAVGKVDEAIEQLRFAADNVHVPEDKTEPLYYLAQALEDADKNDEAKQVYKELLELWPVGYWAEQAKAGLEK